MQANYGKFIIHLRNVSEWKQQNARYSFIHTVLVTIMTFNSTIDI